MNLAHWTSYPVYGCFFFGSRGPPSKVGATSTCLFCLLAKPALTSGYCPADCLRDCSIYVIDAELLGLRDDHLIMIDIFLAM